mmetsp:Transcript_104007/g.155760  ORF Transcript_104007/g.155760 Transcript_104007/m.155760 type:complete len:214 (-) Transcript_104007:27-668(-)|eukprot:CAMPEP_0116999762 /NCGR_PEP_ID=MMETSP0472-20121206/2356_1 /TAXON_ID=693140 ORGANISM="Tiarina fusus, Strain LIS" /NCGR_SAMPLE_ID=MMETSP0472 /ASSEMBLY_ACC=CAM_ASM_000603 /LENGTH=213 /DNA_ID=CAMNT_0004699283 /DNA_START=118 /DNA_END=759 /DNA_ORIENTATION=+
MGETPKQVRFDQVLKHIERNLEGIRTKEELKQLWYSREELVKSCTEAKGIIKIITAVNGDWKAIDHSQVCVVGLEKFHGKKERDKYRKLLVKSVLIRQEMNRGLGLENDARSLCEISEMISSSFKEFALWQAAMHRFHACELSCAKAPSEQLQVSESQPHHQAKRQKLSNGCSVETQIEQQTLPSIQSSQITRKESQLLLCEMQHFVEGYCSR